MAQHAARSWNATRTRLETAEEAAEETAEEAAEETAEEAAAMTCGGREEGRSYRSESAHARESKRETEGEGVKV